MGAEERRVEESGSQRELVLGMRRTRDLAEARSMALEAELASDFLALSSFHPHPDLLRRLAHVCAVSSGHEQQPRDLRRLRSSSRGGS